jgi:hypothetical protein
MKEALRSSETSVLTRATRRIIPQDTILHGHRRENFKSYICIHSFTLMMNAIGSIEMLANTGLFAVMSPKSVAL